MILRPYFDSRLKPPSQITPDLEDKCIHGLLGLGAAEMELALKRSMVGKKTVDDTFIDDLLEEKAQIRIWI